MATAKKQATTTTKRKPAATKPNSVGEVKVTGAKKAAQELAKVLPKKAALAPKKPGVKKLTKVAAGKYVEHTRMTAAERKAQLDKALISTLKKSGIEGTTRQGVADAAKVSSGLMWRYYGNLQGLRTAAVVLAAEAGDMKTVKKAIAAGFDVKALPAKIAKAVKAAG